jgi:hypothetical protein
MSVPSHADVIVLNGRPRRCIVSDYHPKGLNPIRGELAALLRAKQLRAVVSEFHRSRE